jgi:hypothetical protein
MHAVAYAAGRASHARQVKVDDPGKKRYPGPQDWGLGVRLTPPRKKVFLRKLKEIRLDGYLGKDMKQYTKVCGLGHGTN